MSINWREDSREFSMVSVEFALRSTILYILYRIFTPDFFRIEGCFCKEYGRRKPLLLKTFSNKIMILNFLLTSKMPENYGEDPDIFQIFSIIAQFGWHASPNSCRNLCPDSYPDWYPNTGLYVRIDDTGSFSQRSKT